MSAVFPQLYMNLSLLLLDIIQFNLLHYSSVIPYYFFPPHLFLKLTSTSHVNGIGLLLRMQALASKSYKNRFISLYHKMVHLSCFFVKI